MVGADDRPAVGERVLAAMAEARARFQAEGISEGVEGVGAQGDEDAEGGEEHQLAFEVRETVLSFQRQRFVVRRSAADGSRDVGAGKNQAIVAVEAMGLVGEAGAVEGSIKPVAGAVAGEDTAGAVAAVSGRSEADDQDAGGGVAEAWDWAAPVVPLAIRGALLAADGLAPFDQAGAFTAEDNFIG